MIKRTFDRKTLTGTAEYMFQNNFKNDLRNAAPPSDVRIFKKQPDGKEVLVGVQPATSFEQALQITNELHGKDTTKHPRQNKP